MGERARAVGERARVVGERARVVGERDRAVGAINEGVSVALIGIPGEVAPGNRLGEIELERLTVLVGDREVDRPRRVLTGEEKNGVCELGAKVAVAVLGGGDWVTRGWGIKVATGVTNEGAAGAWKRLPDGTPAAKTASFPVAGAVRRVRRTVLRVLREELMKRRKI